MSKAKTAAKLQYPVFEIVMNTDAVMRGELYPDSAPQTVGNFIALANSGFYDGLPIHRCIRSFLIQAGKPLTEELPYCIQGEFEFNRFKLNVLPHERGCICMVRAGHYDSANSQFFIVTTQNEQELSCLNGAYAVFGRVLEGIKVADRISCVETDELDTPLNLPLIRRIRVKTFGLDYPFEKLPPPTSTVYLPHIKTRVKQQPKGGSEIEPTAKTERGLTK
ncbi:MAG: peptidylprolyl isomerase [Clostridia bacterium]